jgi:hypothetical protein
LRASEIATALDNGVEEAEHWLDRGLIEAAVLSLCGEARLVAADPGLYSFERPSREPRYAVG